MEGVVLRFRNHVDSMPLRGRHVARHLHREMSDEVESRFKGKDVTRNNEVVEKSVVVQHEGTEYVATIPRKGVMKEVPSY
ncbi:hypothetical protein CCACVL1_25753 [Corchorus capsularis]|uniref:Uncharacterized protein n=1 Tax=Corchorus capsularis TaxID=210143 RepID=A0A1R3GHB3_COCAP|nr:hypothetical protein CCACVL1_25753 [Corchorus capsularis]